MLMINIILQIIAIGSNSFMIVFRHKIVRTAAMTFRRLDCNGYYASANRYWQSTCCNASTSCTVAQMRCVMDDGQVDHCSSCCIPDTVPLGRKNNGAVNLLIYPRCSLLAACPYILPLIRYTVQQPSHAL